MNAAQALKAARAAGIDLRLDGDDLILEASAPPPAAILELLSRHKPGIAVLLWPDRDVWTAEDWQVFFDERAGIAEFDGGLPRLEAEARAFACCVVHWMNRNYLDSSPRRGLACGGGDHAHDALLPHCIKRTGPACLNSCRQPVWQPNRRAEAVAALAAMGITAGVKFPNDFGKNGDV